MYTVNNSIHIKYKALLINNLLSTNILNHIFIIQSYISSKYIMYTVNNSIHIKYKALLINNLILLNHIFIILSYISYRIMNISLCSLFYIIQSRINIYIQRPIYKSILI